MQKASTVITVTPQASHIAPAAKQLGYSLYNNPSGKEEKPLVPENVEERRIAEEIIDSKPVPEIFPIKYTQPN